MSSKKAMKLAQKQAFAKHRSNITNTKFGSKKTSFSNKLNKIKGKNKKFPDLSPVNALPVLVPPCAAGARPRIISLAFVSPKPVTGFAQ